jgi:hypothetical protein
VCHAPGAHTKARGSGCFKVFIVRTQTQVFNHTQAAGTCQERLPPDAFNKNRAKNTHKILTHSHEGRRPLLHMFTRSPGATALCCNKDAAQLLSHHCSWRTPSLARARGARQQRGDAYRAAAAAAAAAASDLPRAHCAPTSFAVTCTGRRPFAGASRTCRRRKACPACTARPSPAGGCRRGSAPRSGSTDST